ncbi:hypothetical protein BLNAU_5737 [Blattamonas nauphoetae]|uniref:Uncharacterized protein n=1 Tax=Blattamonas nauphoetae TaxID=2049346 RepID=A0ABQ9Y649_9EUKA|nr:hypothetical protein BLNAU_5737 [Blattamonas nauphoetae]
MNSSPHEEFVTSDHTDQQFQSLLSTVSGEDKEKARSSLSALFEIVSESPATAKSLYNLGCVDFLNVFCETWNPSTVPNWHLFTDAQSVSLLYFHFHI